MFRNTAYYFKQLWINLTRNMLMSAAAISTSFFSQLILGGLLLIVFNINHVTSKIWSELEIWVFIDSSNTEQVNTYMDKLKNHNLVDSVDKISPDKALKGLEKELDVTLWERDEDNPLPWTLVVRVKDPDHITPLVDYIVNDLGIKKENVRYPEDVVKKINAASMTIKVGGYILTVLMAALTLFIIVNTIRLTVLARRGEIRTMQLVGATSWFIRWPFLLEGIMIGLIGSLVSAFLLSGLYYVGFHKYIDLLSFLPRPIDTFQMVRVLFVALGVSGLCMGLAGSYISIAKFLDEDSL